MKNLISFFCVFMYYMSPYRLAGHQMPELVGLLAVVLAIVSGYKFKLDKGFQIFVVYMWIVPVIAGQTTGISGNWMEALIPIGLILSTLYLGFLQYNVDKESVLKFYKILVYAAIIFFVIQELSYIFGNYRPTLYLSFLEAYYEDTDVDMFATSRASLDRSSSFFLEPSHFVQYIIPYFCIIVSRYLREKKGFKEMVGMLIIIIWIRAGVGYVTLLVIAGFLFLRSDIMRLYQRILILLSICTALILINTLFADNKLISETMGRMSEFSMDFEASGAQSGFIRIWRGYIVYGTLGFLNKFFGVSIAGIEPLFSSVIIPGCRYDGAYMNGIQTILISGGLVGLFLFTIYIRSLYMKMDIIGQCILVAMITIFFFEHMLYTPKMFLYILLASCFIIPSACYKSNKYIKK